MIDELDRRFPEAIYYAMRECLNGEIDHRHDDLIRWAIGYIESDEFPADLEVSKVSDAELLALAMAAGRRKSEA